MHNPVEDSMVLLRQDAIERGLQESAIVFGWSVMLLRAERIDRLMGDINSTLLKNIPLIYNIEKHK